MNLIRPSYSPFPRALSVREAGFGLLLLATLVGGCGGRAATTGNTAQGVECGSHDGCDTTNQCAGGMECIAFTECGGAICIASETACAESCPDPTTCLLAESSPAQLSCEGRVAAHPDDEQGVGSGGSASATGTNSPTGTSAGGVSSGGSAPTGSGGSARGGNSSGGGVNVGGTPAQGGVATGGNDGTRGGEGGGGATQGGAAGAGGTGDGGFGALAGAGGFGGEGGATQGGAGGATNGEGAEGIHCPDYDVCSLENSACGEGETCTSVAGCESAICIASAEACELSCPDPDECAIQESFPVQISCPGRVNGNNEPSGAANLDDLHAQCTDGECPDGLTAVTYYGIAGPSGPEFCSCEIPCGEGEEACPDGTSCVTIADGPGEVCDVVTR